MPIYNRMHVIKHCDRCDNDYSVMCEYKHGICGA